MTWLAWRQARAQAAAALTVPVAAAAAALAAGRADERGEVRLTALAARSSRA